MSLYTRDTWQFSSPCLYVPLSQYDWAYFDPTPPPGCGTLPWNPVVFSLLAAFQAGTFLLGLEVTVEVLAQFRRKRLYFWSIMVASWGAMLFSAATFILQYAPPPSAIYGSIIMSFAWVAMVTGFSLVLYSRLHLLNPGPKVLRIVLICIIVDALLFHLPVVITTIISNIHFTPATWKAFEITSYTEIVFSVQETLITTLYIYLFLVYTKGRRKEPSTRAILWQLFVAEFVVFSTDIILNVLLYLEIYLPRQMIQSFSSMLKLRIEFAILNSLIRYSKSKASEQMDLGRISDGDISVQPMRLHHRDEKQESGEAEV